MMKERIVRFLRRQWSEWRGVVFFVVFVFVPFRSSIADWNWVPTGSMIPTIMEGDLVYVNKLAYELRFPLTLQRLKQWAHPERGDIVVLFSPADDLRLVKRVVGVPGDEVEMRNNVLWINGMHLDYSPLPKEYTNGLRDEIRRSSLFAEENLGGKKHAVMSVPGLPSRRRSFGKIVVPEDRYFLMGDNRDLSKDSRSFGLVERRLIIAKATHVIASFDKRENYEPRIERFFTLLN